MDVERDPGWPALAKALKRAGCAVCRIGSAAGDRTARTLLSEHLSDPASRRELDDALGFCARHWDLVTSRGDAFANAIALGSVLGEASQRLEARRRRRARLVPGDPCALCAAEAAAERDAAALLCAAAVEEQGAERLRDAAPLCLRHVGFVVDVREHGLGRARVLARARDQLATLGGELTALVDAYDHRSAGVAPGQADAWRRALAVARGGAPPRSPHPTLPPGLARALETVAARLLARDVPFALGGSALLVALGVALPVRDLDLVLPPEAEEPLRAATLPWWRSLERDGTDLWASAWKAVLEVEGVSVEAVGGQALRHEGRVVAIPFRQAGTWRVGAVDVPLAPAELWWAIYRLYRPEKAALLERLVPAEARRAVDSELGLA